MATSRARRDETRRSHRRGPAQPVETHRPPRPVPTSWTWGEGPHRRGEGGCRSGASGARPAQGQRGQPDHPRLRPRLRPGATGGQRRSVGLLDASLALSERRLAAGFELQRRGCWPARGTRAALPMLEARRRAALYERLPRGARRASWTLLPRPAPAYRNCAVPCPPATAGARWRAARTSARAERSPPPTPRALAEAELYPRISRVGAETSAVTSPARRQRRAGLRGRPARWRRFPNRESAREAAWTAQAADAALARFDGAVLGALREVECPWRCMPASASACRPPACPSTSSATPTGWRAATIAPAPLDALEPARQPTQPGRRPGAPGRRRDARRRAPGRTVPALGGGWQAAPSPSHQENGQ